MGERLASSLDREWLLPIARRAVVIEISMRGPSVIRRNFVEPTVE